MIVGNMMEQSNPIEILASGDIPDDYLLSSIYEIENILLMIEENGKKVDHLKGLKKHRAKYIDDDISKFQGRNTRLREVIYNTMSRLSPKEKTIPFPGIGKVSRRKVKDTWTISDEEKMLKFFEDEGVKDQAVREVVDAREAKKLLDSFEDLNTTVPGVEKKLGGESISITFEKEEKRQPRPDSLVGIPVQKDVLTDLDLDELEL